MGNELITQPVKQDEADVVSMAIWNDGADGSLASKEASL